MGQVTYTPPDRSPLIPQVAERLFPLVDRLYDRAANLIDKDINLFRFDEEFIATICEHAPDAIHEHASHCVWFSKFELSQGTFQTEEFHRDLMQRRQRELDTGRSWEGYPTQYLRSFHQRRLESRESRHELTELQNRFNLRIWEAWGEEMESHITGAHQRYEKAGTEAPALLTENLIEQTLSGSGFTRDRRLTRSTTLVYSKPLAEPWVVCVCVDRKSLVEPITRVPPNFSVGSNGQVCLPTGPKFFMYFGIVNRNTRKALNYDNEQALLLKFEWLLPIRKAPLWSDYQRFYSMRELEALVNISLQFYRLLAPEFEHAVQAGLARNAQPA